MRMVFPSPEFDDAVAAVCHGQASDEQARSLNELLRQNSGARDEYILRVELHSRLASEVDIFASRQADEVACAAGALSENRSPTALFPSRLISLGGLAACLAFGAVVAWRWLPHPRENEAAKPVVATLAVSPWKPSSANLPGQEYPRVAADRRAQFRIKAPEAKQVSLYLSGNVAQPETVTRSEDGVWTITTKPLGIGFHFYRFIIDGSGVADPATQVFHGGGGDWISSGIEVPTGEDFHERQNVPQGEVREVRFFSQVTASTRRVFVYTPPGYDREPTTRYPVLYLLPGAGEDETVWAAQGHVSQILDNLVAAQKAKPMIVVMDGGSARKPEEIETAPRPPADPNRRYVALEEVFVHDLIPLVDRTYRTIADGQHRALAGLSLGGAQAFAIGLRRTDLFASIGGFSGAGMRNRVFDARTAHEGAMADSDAFNRRMRVVFLSVGAQETDGMATSVRQYREALQGAGIDHVFYESPATAHEWHTWRRSLHEFAPLLFKD